MLNEKTPDEFVEIFEFNYLQTVNGELREYLSNCLRQMLNDTLVSHPVQQNVRQGQDGESGEVICADEKYPRDWVRLNLIVGPLGHYYVTGGDRKTGKGDMPFKAMDFIEIIPKRK